MKILVPLNSEECLEEYVEAGADELYMGFYDEKWFETNHAYGVQLSNFDKFEFFFRVKDIN